jgi:hypothetical protein
MSFQIRAMPVAALCLLLAGCDDWGDWGDSQRYKENFQYSHALQPGGRISVENLNGAVEIQGWEKDGVDITGTKYASTEQVLNAMKVDVIASGDTVRIRTVSPSGHRGNHGARYMIRVPYRTALERITTSNASIRVDSVEGDARLKTSNGAVRVFRLKGPVEVETSNGSVEIMEHSGAVVAHTSNGAIRADNVRGDFEATTSNGSITARLTDPEAGRPVKLESSNGSITLTMDALRENPLRLSTSNSSIELRLPSSTNAQLRAATSSASITTDFDVAVRGQVSKHRLEGQIGSGGPVLDLSTSNGSIKVLKL